MAKESPNKKKPTAPSPAPELRLLPMQLKLGHRLVDETGEIDGRPYVTNQGKTAHVRVRRIDQPDVTQIRSWGAHGRIAVRAVSRLAGLTAWRMWIRQDQEVDELRTTLNQLIDLMTKHVESQGRLQEAWVGLLRVVASDDVKNQVKGHVSLLRTATDAIKGLHEAAMAHERRLKAIEEAGPSRRLRKVKKPKVGVKRTKR